MKPPTPQAFDLLFLSIFLLAKQLIESFADLLLITG
jgi:hypothetical protein